MWFCPLLGSIGIFAIPVQFRGTRQISTPPCITSHCIQEEESTALVNTIRTCKARKSNRNKHYDHNYLPNESAQCSQFRPTQTPHATRLSIANVEPHQQSDYPPPTSKSYCCNLLCRVLGARRDESGDCWVGRAPGRALRSGVAAFGYRAAECLRRALCGASIVYASRCAVVPSDFSLGLGESGMIVLSTRARSFPFCQSCVKSLCSCTDNEWRWIAGGLDSLRNWNTQAREDEGAWSFDFCMRFLWHNDHWREPEPLD